MRHSRRAMVALATMVMASCTLAGCATAVGSAPTASPAGPFLGEVQPPLPAGEVLAQAMVLETAGNARLCLGGVAESYPPQCSGIPIINWTWDGLDGYERSGDTTWGTYAVTGTYDDETFTVTQDPVSLALFDPPTQPQPVAPDGGPVDEETLVDIQQDLHDRPGVDILISGPQDGRLWVSVTWDDGTLQAAADREFGAGVVWIDSALRPVG